MDLSIDLVREFAKTAKSDSASKGETVLYGTIVKYEGSEYVRLDGSDQLTPVSSTVIVRDGDRAMVLIKNHSATVVGNTTSPAAQDKDVQEIGSKISEVEILIADKVDTIELNAERARIDELEAKNVTITGELDATKANIDELKAKDVTIEGSLTAQDAEIQNLKTKKLDADIADIKYATIGSLEATDATIHNLQADYGDFKVLTTDKFTAVEGNITRLDTEKLSVDEAEIKFANIDFSNIGKAAIEEFFAKSGMITDLVVGDGVITGKLVGVTIIGDLIEGGTIKADKLVVKGTDGLYYKLNTNGETVSTEQTEYNSLNGSILTAKSVTAEKVNVHDLVAFDATIGGFHIKEDAIYSGVKETVDNTTRGVYLDDDGQVAFGDSKNFLKYYRAEDGTYKLAISADSILLGASGASVEESITDLDSQVENTQNSVDDAQAAVSSHEVRLVDSEAAIKILKDSISTIITDENGNSMMTQTSDGWTFNMSAIENTISDTVETLNGLSSEIDTVDGMVSNMNSLVNDLAEKTAYIIMTTDETGSPCIELGKEENDFKVRITNTSVDFMEGSSKIAYISNKALYIERAVIKDELQIGEGEGFIWKRRSNGNMGLRWIEKDLEAPLIPPAVSPQS